MEPENVVSLLALGGDFDPILFKIAIYFAENGLSVWFISAETFNKAPGNIRPPDKEILQLITFLYLKDGDDLVSHLNSIHIWHKVPNVIIVSGFENYCNLNLETCALKSALVCTSLLNSASVCVSKNSKKCFILLSSTCSFDTEKRLQTIVDIYFPNFIHKVHDEEFLNYVIKTFK